MKNLFKENEKVIIKKKLSLIDEKISCYSQSVGVPDKMKALEGSVFTINRILNKYNKYFLYILKEDKEKFFFHEKMLSKYIDENNNFLLNFY
jgi:hypothetical protein